MSAERAIASHLRLAASALEAAETLLAILNRNAAYEAEQAVEQLILAVAQAEQVHFGRALHHQLDRMVAMLPAENPSRDALGRLTWLEAYATTYRYPRPSGALSRGPSQDKLAGAIREARAVLDKLAAFYGVDPAISADAPARHSRPARTGDL